MKSAVLITKLFLLMKLPSGAQLTSTNFGYDGEHDPQYERGVNGVNYWVYMVERLYGRGGMGSVGDHREEMHIPCHSILKERE